MRFHIVIAGVFSLLLGTGALAQATFTHGESKRCESLTGAAKDQCDKEEATKTQGPAALEMTPPSPSAASGGTSFTHGESARCESLSGPARAQCDKDEATKTEGQSARD